MGQAQGLVVVAAGLILLLKTALGLPEVIKLGVVFIKLG